MFYLLQDIIYSYIMSINKGENMSFDTDIMTTIPVEFHEGHVAQAGDYLLGVIEELYGEKAFDHDKFEGCLEQLADMLSVDMPITPLTMRPKSSRKD